MPTLLLSLLKSYWPQIAALIGAIGIGFGAAWGIQGLRITSAEQEFTAYKQTIKEQELRWKSAADQQRQDAAMEYAAQQGALNHEIEKGIVYRRCVAAGKCGARMLEPAGCSATLRVPAGGGIDGAGPNAIPAGREPAAEGGPEVVNECAVTTLRLNRLQAAIERQEGYAQKEEALKAPPVGP